MSLQTNNEVPTYKFRCECQVEYDRLQAVCGEGMNDAKVIPQFIKEIPIPDRVVEFTSTLSYEQLLRMYGGVADAHIAFQTLMPIEEYTGERDYDRSTLDKTDLSNIIETYVKKYIEKGCRGFGSYDGFRAHLYGKVDQAKTVQFLLDNWTVLNFDYDELAKCTNTDNYNVLFEMKKVLMMAVLQSFDVNPYMFKDKKNDYHLQYNVEINVRKETEKLRPILTEYLRKAIFRRMAQQTIYGFI